MEEWVKKQARANAARKLRAVAQDLRDIEHDIVDRLRPSGYITVAIAEHGLDRLANEIEEGPASADSKEPAE